MIYLSCTILVLSSCKRPIPPYIPDITYSGQVVTSESSPIANVLISLVYNDNQKEQLDKTDSVGRFIININKEKIPSSKCLLFDGGGSHRITKELVNIGNEYDYGKITLYNSQMEALPKIYYMGKTYYIHPELGGEVGWPEAMSACQNMEAEHSYDCNDWELPSRNLIQIMYDNRDSIGGFSDRGYWTKDVSTDGTFFYFMDFNTGEISFTENPQLQFCVRPVRTNSGSDSNEPIPAEGSISQITAHSAKYAGNILSTGGSDIVERGVCYSVDENPTINNNYCSAGTGGGEFTCILTNLQPKTTYHIRAYAKNQAGKERYGSEFVFETKTVEKPEVVTIRTYDISENSATIEGNVISDGGEAVTERGVCWSMTNTNPTTGDNHVSSGNGLGNYYVTITGLEAGTTYYVNTYAKNSAGTSYGNVKTFTTSSIVVGDITATTLNPTEVSYNSAKLNGRITFDDNSPVIDKYGFCYGTSMNTGTIIPINGVITSSPTDFSYTLSGLNTGTTYYTKAYTINSATGDTIYGETKSFSTSSYSVELSINNIIANWSNYAICSIMIVWDSHETIEYGVCWSESSNPTIDNNHTSYIFTPSGTNLPHSSVHDFLIDNLTANTTYHIRAYAVTSQGDIYYNNEERTFTTTY